MQREILFRGKREDKGVWVYGYITHLTGMPKKCIMQDGYYISDEQGRQPTYLVDESTVGQYTGLEDSAGKKIFERDILMFPKFPGNGKFVAAFHRGCFYAVELEYYGKKDIEELPMFSAYWWANNGNGIPEIIGNVHDTPELLDRDKDVPL